MSYNKLNILHWHITDTHSFPLHLENLPELAKYGAYSASKTYYKNEVQDLIQYAKIRGVRIIPEFDAPAHVGSGWQQFNENNTDWGNIILCYENEEWNTFCAEPPCGQVRRCFSPGIMSRMQKKVHFGRTILVHCLTQRLKSMWEPE